MGQATQQVDTSEGPNLAMHVSELSRNVCRQSVALNMHAILGKRLTALVMQKPTTPWLLAQSPKLNISLG